MTDYDELRRLAAAATPGPWKVHPFVDAIDIRDANGCGIASLSDRVISDLGMPPDNAAFIATARTAIPELLDALEAARKRANDLERQLEKLGIYQETSNG